MATAGEPSQNKEETKKIPCACLLPLPTSSKTSVSHVQLAAAPTGSKALKKHSFALICIVRFCRYQPLSSNGLRLFYAVEPLDHESGAVGHIYVPRYLRILCFWALYLTHNLYVGLHIQTVILKYWALNVDHYSSLSPIIWAIYADHFYYRILWQKKHAA